MSGFIRFFGDSPLRVLLKLLLLSFLVGVVMSVFGWYPLDVFYAARDLLVDLWNMGFAAVDRFIGYILLGAAVVVPVFLIIRVASYRR